MFTAKRLKVCPRVMLSPWTGYVFSAKAWHEKGELGLSFINAPVWVRDAFNLIDSETSKALDFKNRK